jgi:hypothetical protein
MIFQRIIIRISSIFRRAEPQCQTTPVEFGSPHESIGPGFVYMYLPIHHCYRFTSSIPDVCHAWGACGLHNLIPKHSKHHYRQRDASQSVKLDLAPNPSQSPLHIYNVRCLSKPASYGFYSLVFHIHHPCMRRELPCSIHTPMN